MTETPGWTSPGSPQPAPGTTGSGHPAPHPAPAPAASAAAVPGPVGTPGPALPLTPTPGPIPLRPLGFGELLDGAFALVRQYWRASLGLSLVLAATLELVQAVVDWWLHVDGTTTEAALSSYYTLPLDMLAGLIATGLLSGVVSNSLLGRDTTLAQAWAQARPQLGRLLALALLHTLIMIGAMGVLFVPLVLVALSADQPALILLMLPAVVPAVWLWIKLAFAAPALMLEKQGVTSALKRSWRLTNGSWWRIFGTVLVFGICLSLLTLVLAGPGELAALIIGGGPGSPDASDLDAGLSIGISAIFTTLAKTLTIPLSGTLIALLYVDRRIRREALDLEIARAAGLPGYATGGWQDTRATAPVPGPHTPPGA